MPNPTALPSNIYRYVWQASGWHQLPLVLLTACVALLEVVPLELQRRLIDDIVKHRNYELIMVLCAVYLGAVLLQAEPAGTDGKTRRGRTSAIVIGCSGVIRDLSTT